MLVNQVAMNDGGGGSAASLNGYSYKVSDFLNIVKAEIGYKEKATNSNLDSKTGNAGNANWTKYARDLYNAGYYQSSKNGLSWDDVFVDWCVYKLVCNVTGLSGSSVRAKANELICVDANQLAGANCSSSLNYYKSKNRFGNLPVAGAQIFFSSNGGAIIRTGVVIRYDDNKVYTVEGNVSNQVKECSYSRNSSNIAGYGYPKLTGLSIPSAAVPPAENSNSLGESTKSSSSGTSNSSTVNMSFNGLKYSADNPPLYCGQTQSTCYKQTSKNMTVRGILWHDTGAGNPNLKRYVQPSDNAPDKAKWLELLGKNTHGNDWNHTYTKAGLNCWIGKLANGTVTTVQTMPWTYKPWGCGSGSSGSCNDGWIQFEICDDYGHGDSESYFRAAYEEACQLTAYLCVKFNLDPQGTVRYKGKDVPVILDHRTAHKLGLGSNHGDVRNWFKKWGKYDDTDGMRIVRKDVATLLKQGSTGGASIVKKGDIVGVKEGAVSQDGQKALAYITSQKWKVTAAESFSEYATLGARADTSSIVLNKSYRKVDLVVSSATGSVGSSSNTGTVTNEERIWNLLSQKVKNSSGATNPYGVAGIMGNLMAESGLKPKNLQNSFERKLTNRSGTEADNYYTAAVDNGTYTNFVRDGAGYGLAQWTYWSLKEDLLEHARSKGKSIGDLDVQIEFLCKQLSTEYKSVWNTCCNAKTVKEASDKMLHGFERPYGHDGVNKDSQERTRASYGQGFYERHQNACTHGSTTRRDAVDATCYSDGYTGDVVCNNCGQTVEYGTILPAKQHTLVNGVCSVCGGVPGSDPTTGTTGGSIIVNPGLVTRDDLLKMLEFLQALLRREGDC